jgi:hypothetical protein
MLVVVEYESLSRPMAFPLSVPVALPYSPVVAVAVGVLYYLCLISTVRVLVSLSFLANTISADVLSIS